MLLIADLCCTVILVVSTFEINSAGIETGNAYIEHLNLVFIGPAALKWHGRVIMPLRPYELFRLLSGKHPDLMLKTLKKYFV